MESREKSKFAIFFLIIFCLILVDSFFSFHVFSSKADTIPDLQRQIDEKNSQIADLQKQADQFRLKIAGEQSIGNSLKAEINRINDNIIKLRNDIAIAENKIEKIDLNIKKTELQISESEITVSDMRGSLGLAIESIAESDSKTPLAVLLSDAKLSSFFSSVQYTSLLENKIIETVGDLKIAQSQLENQKNTLEDEKTQSQKVKAIFDAQRGSLLNQKNDQKNLLAETRSRESAYQTLLKESEYKQAALQSEIQAIEEKIKFSYNPNSIPSPSHGILGSPLPELVLSPCPVSDPNANCITQYFGYTQYAAVGAYRGQGHNGVDFRAPVGTPVYAADNGVVAGTGNTDLECRRAAFGKWILLKYDNNLASLYGHLSSIQVSDGEKIKRGEFIGLSGDSGFATGPHLHFGVYISQAVQIDTIRSKSCGTDIIMPISPVNGYLNPLDYL